MSRYVALHRMSFPLPNSTRRAGGSSRRATRPEGSAIEFVATLVFIASAIVVGLALIMTAPQTVTVPIATVLVFGFIASALVPAADRWLARRRAGFTPRQEETDHVNAIVAGE